MPYEIVQISEIPERNKHWAERKDLTEVLNSVPENGKAIVITINDKNQFRNDTTCLRHKNKRGKLGITVINRGNKIYLFKEDK